MKAKDLIKHLIKYPDAEIVIIREEWDDPEFYYPVDFIEETKYENQNVFKLYGCEL